MIYFLYGENKDQARKKAHEIIESLQKKKPHAAFFRIDSENWGEAVLDEYIRGQGLFSQKYIIFADSVLENEVAKESIVKQIEEISQSENIFIFLSSDVDKLTLVAFKKHAQKSQTFALSDRSRKAKEFNIFGLGDALGRKDKKNLWVLYSKAKRAGLEDEHIHGTLFWAVKNMIVAGEHENAKEAGLNPFVFGKANSFARNFEKNELKKLSSALVTLYHRSHRGESDLDVSLERFILNL